MKKNTNTASEAAADEVPGLPEGALHDQFAGRGGSYVYDPVRGVRVPADEVNERPAAEGVTSNE